MFNLLIMIFIMILISMFMMMMNLIFSKKSLKNREKSSPFECGFDPMSSTRIPFSIQFFMISLIFLIFDIEISLLIPLISMLFYTKKFLIISSMIFISTLLLGLYIEFLEKSLNWK